MGDIPTNNLAKSLEKSKDSLSFFEKLTTEIVGKGVGGVAGDVAKDFVEKWLTKNATSAEGINLAIGAGWGAGRIVDGTVGYALDQVFGEVAGGTIGGGKGGRLGSFLEKILQADNEEDKLKGFMESILAKGGDAVAADLVKGVVKWIAEDSVSDVTKAYQNAEDGFNQWAIDFEKSFINWAYPNSDLSQIYQTP